VTVAVKRRQAGAHHGRAISEGAACSSRPRRWRQPAVFGRRITIGPGTRRFADRARRAHGQGVLASKVQQTRDVLKTVMDDSGVSTSYARVGDDPAAADTSQIAVSWEWTPITAVRLPICPFDGLVLRY